MIEIPQQPIDLPTTYLQGNILQYRSQGGCWGISSSNVVSWQYRFPNLQAVAHAVGLAERLGEAGLASSKGSSPMERETMRMMMMMMMMMMMIVITITTFFLLLLV